jgi:hypothetical protein
VSFGGKYFPKRYEYSSGYRGVASYGSLTKKDYPMTTAHAFGRLFPPALFLIVGLFLSSFWSPDPALLVVALIAAGMCAAWLIIATAEVIKRLHVEPLPLPATPVSASPTAE